MDERELGEWYECVNEREREQVRQMRLNGRSVQLPRNVVWDDGLGHELIGASCADHSGF